MSQPAAENPPETPGRENLKPPYEPGTTGNPGGRPKGLAKRVRDQVGSDGEPLVVLMLAIVYNEKESTRDRMDAAKWLADRGWGKAPVFAPIEDDDPLEMSEREASAIAAGFDARLDELAAKRDAKETAA